jgi:hypothetical protein
MSLFGSGGAVSNKKLKKQVGYQTGLEQEAQTANLTANRANQIGPTGSMTWSQDPSTGQWTQTTSLNPAEQQQLDQRRGLLSGLGGAAQGLVGQVGQAFGQGLDTSGLAPGPTGAPTGPQFNRDFGTIDPALLANLAGGASGAGTAQAKEYELQKKLDLSGLSAMPEASEAVRQQVIDAVNQKARSLLDPQQANQRRDLLDRLYAMGGREGDPMFENEKRKLEQQISLENQQTGWDAITQGGAEQQRLFDMGLRGRSQTFNEALQGGQFTNQALTGQFEQGAENARMANQVGVSNAQIANANAGRRLEGMLAGLDYNRQGTVLGNEASQRGFENELTSQRQQQDIRNRQFEEMLAQRGLPFQELSSVLGTLGEVQDPQFGGYFQDSRDAVDYLGAWDANQQRKAAQQQALIGAAGQIAGAVANPIGGAIGGAGGLSGLLGGLGGSKTLGMINPSVPKISYT